MQNTTLAMPLVVPNAKLTLDKSVGLTKLCWYIKRNIKTKAPN
jgi:hypothetical protein